MLSLNSLERELANFEDMAKQLMPQPGEKPDVAGIDVFGGTVSLRGSVGGDHLIYVDFTQRFDLDARIRRAHDEGRADVAANLERCRRMAGIALLDVSGHQVTDAFLAAMVHQAFLLGAIYELDSHGHVTSRLFEHLNTRLYQSSGAQKFVSMIYGEISDDAKFRFISAAQPLPLVFSRKHDRFMDIESHLRVSFPPLGLLPSLDVIDRSRTTSSLGFKEHYEMNEWQLMGDGDILLLTTDGITEHQRGDADYVPGRLEDVLRRVKDESAAGIFEAITADVLQFNEPADDISLVVIKKA